MRFMVGHCGKCLGKKMTGHYITANEHLMRGRPWVSRCVVVSLVLIGLGWETWLRRYVVSLMLRPENYAS